MKITVIIERKLERRSIRPIERLDVKTVSIELPDQDAFTVPPIPVEERIKRTVSVLLSELIVS